MRTNLLVNNKIKVFIPFCILLITLLIVSEKKSIAYSSFAPAGVTGSPGDGMNCTGCHSGTAQSLTTGITTTIPVSGYIPGTTYDITIGNEVAQAGKTKYGFAMTVQKGTSQTLLGSFTPKSGLLLGLNYITHDGAQSSSPFWQFQWKAPSAGTGAVTFSAAINAANGDGGTTGDQILTYSSIVQEDVSNGISDLNSNNNFKALVNNNSLNLSFYSNHLTLFYLQLIDINGREVLAKHLNAVQGNNSTIIALENSLSSGIYVVKLTDFEQNYQTKIIKP